MPVTQTALRTAAGGRRPIGWCRVRAHPYSLYTAKVETQMSHGFLGPLETVDPHDPVGPLHDRETSIRWRSKKSKKLKRIYKSIELSTRIRRARSFWRV